MPKLHLFLAILLVLAFIPLPSKADEPKAENSLFLASGVYQADPDKGIFIVLYNLGDTILTENCAEYADGTACDLTNWTYFVDNLYVYSSNEEQKWLHIYPENPEHYSFSFTHFLDNGNSAFAAYQWFGPELPTNLRNYSRLNLGGH
jgi:hypothetical protein